MRHVGFYLIFSLTVCLLSQVLCSCDDIFEEDISDKKVQIVSPSDGAVLTSDKMWLVWNKLEGAHYYHISVVSPRFDNIQSYVCDTVLCDSLLSGYKLEVKLTDGDYQWAIRAKNSAYESLTNYSSFKVLADEE